MTCPICSRKYSVVTVYGLMDKEIDKKVCKKHLRSLLNLMKRMNKRSNEVK